MPRRPSPCQSWRPPKSAIYLGDSLSSGVMSNLRWFAGRRNTETPRGGVLGVAPNQQELQTRIVGPLSDGTPPGPGRWRPPTRVGVDTTCARNRAPRHMGAPQGLSTREGQGREIQRCRVSTHSTYLGQDTAIVLANSIGKLRERPSRHSKSTYVELRGWVHVRVSPNRRFQYSRCCALSRRSGPTATSWRRRPDSNLERCTRY
jgi:hypothetical protein